MNKNRGRAALYCLVVVLILVALDQWTKHDIVKNIPLGDSVVMIPGFFELTHVRNTGMAFSMFDDAGMGFFIALTLVVIAGMVYFFFKTHDAAIQLSLTLIIAGAIGNLIDRITQGYVTDFFRFYIFGHPFAVFNVADVCISIGFVCLVLVMIYEEIKENRIKKEAGLKS